MVIEEKVWYTGTYNEGTKKSEIFFHIRRKHHNGSIEKYDFKGVPKK